MYALNHGRFVRFVIMHAAFYLHKKFSVYLAPHYKKKNFGR